MSGSPTASGLLLPVLALSSAVTLAAVALSTAASGVVWRSLAGTRARRGIEARETEAGHVAALAQRWSRTPAVLGGPLLPGEGFAAVTFDTLGLARDARDASVRRTEIGTYRLLAVASCEALDRHAASADTPSPAGGGLLVVGTCERPADAVAVLVLGPLVQILLPEVPWAWVRDLLTPAAVRRPAPRQESGVPQHGRAMPSWRSPKPTRRRRDRTAERSLV